uniref:CIDE-N domain-containing protein n=1 Tax=Clastoptera arizonana TaxID=38151 RepID=A0A1B6D4X6_9HEMI
MGVLKGFKVSNAKRSKMVGVACRNFKELIEKACNKFQISDKKVEVYLQDGTLVDSEDYFQSLPPQTVLLLKQDSEEIVMGVDIIYNALKLVNIDLLRAGEEVKNFFDEHLKEKVKVLVQAINNVKGNEDKTKLSSRNEDPDWFIGVETNATSKEAFMFRRSQDRIRGYHYKTMSDIKKSSNFSEKLNRGKIS